MRGALIIWTKKLIAGRDGKHLYVTVGSNSNVAENGMDKEANRAAILEIDPATGNSRVFASGLRNPNGMGWQPQSGALWTAVNERDEIGSDLVPDYMTSVKDGGFYGWPYGYYGQHVDERVKPPHSDLVAKEFTAARDDEQGTLVLSQFTGAARELDNALIVNPYNVERPESPSRTRVTPSRCTTAWRASRTATPLSSPATTLPTTWSSSRPRRTG